MQDDPVEEVLDLIANGDQRAALEQLEQLIREEPYQGGLIALRGLLLSDLGRVPEARAAMREALDADNGSPFLVWAAGAVALRAGEVHEAITFAVEAQRRGERYPDATMLEARARAMLGQWPVVEKLARQVLEWEPAHAEAVVLAQIAVGAEGKGPLDAAAWQDIAKRFPFDPTARAANGWGRLESGRAHEAREEFEQALALDPNATWAREGLVLALKAQNPIYAQLLRFFIWSGRLEPRTRNLILIGGVIGYNFLRSVSRSSPELAPFILPLLIGYAAFVFLTWLADPLLNLVLMTNPTARARLSADDRHSGLAVGGCLALALLLAIVGAVLDASGPMTAAFPVAFASLVAAAHFGTEPSSKRDRLGVAALLVLGLGLLVAILPSDLRGLPLLAAILIGVASTWYARLADARPKYS